MSHVSVTVSASRRFDCKVAPPSLAVLIDREIDALDQLAALTRCGVKSAREFDELEERAGAIGERLRAAFRTVRARG